MQNNGYKVKTLKGYKGRPPEMPLRDANFQTFEDLETYQAAREFRKAMYAVSRQLPAEEKYGLAGQIRRAAVSLTNNLAEGHGRFHYADQIKFVLMARGSLQELVDDLNVCFDENYLPPEETGALKDQAWHVLRIINGYGRFLRQKRAAQTGVLRETGPDEISEDADPFEDVPL
jgi:four helix bundle protein